MKLRHNRQWRIVRFLFITFLMVAPVWALDGPTLQWNTFVGTYWETGWSIALDGAGNIYVTGASWTTWGTPVNATVFLPQGGRNRRIESTKAT